MFAQLNNLAEEARRLSPDEGERKRWAQAIFAYTEGYYEALADSPAYHDDPSPSRDIARTPIPEAGLPMEQILGQFRQQVEATGINPTSGKFMGYIPGGGLYPSALGDWLAAITNRYASVFFASPGAAAIENRLVQWAANLMGFPEKAGGFLASGASMATLSCIHTAREHQQITHKQVDRAVVYLSSETHHVITKCIHIAGMKAAILRQIPVDEAFRMDPQALQAQVEADKASGLIPFLLVGSLGTTNTGAVDPIPVLADIAATHGMWFHIDAAYGGFFALSELAREHFEGVDRAHSLVADPHKSLFLPYGTGLALVRDLNWMREAHAYMGDYMLDTLVHADQVSPADISPELTKHFRGLRMWFPLQLMGLAPFRAALSEKILLARYAYMQIARLPDAEMGPEPGLSVFVFRFCPQGVDPEAFNATMARDIQAQGQVFLSTTRLKGVFFLRVAILCFRTHREEVDLLIQTVRDHLLQQLEQVAPSH